MFPQKSCFCLWVDTEQIASISLYKASGPKVELFALWCQSCHLKSFHLDLTSLHLPTHEPWRLLQGPHKTKIPVVTASNTQPEEKKFQRLLGATHLEQGPVPRLPPSLYYYKPPWFDKFQHTSLHPSAIPLPSLLKSVYILANAGSTGVYGPKHLRQAMSPSFLCVGQVLQQQSWGRRTEVLFLYLQPPLVQ